MPIKRTDGDDRTPEQKAADESALREFEAGRFLSDEEKTAAALKRARERAEARRSEGEEDV